LAACCDTAKSALEADFSNLFSVLSQPAFVMQAALDQLNTIVNLFDDLKRLGGAIFALVDNDTPDISQLVLQPVELATGLSGLMGSVNTEESAAVLATTDTFALYENLITALPEENATLAVTPSRVQQAANSNAINDLITGLAIVESATAIAASDATFPTYNAAISTQEVLLEHLDALIERSPTATYYPLANLQSAIIKRVDDLAPGLLQIEQIQIAQPLPALVLAHQLYQRSDKAEELILRNQITHPLFIPAGVDLEVLT